MSERRTAPRTLKPAETTALVLGMIAVLGNLGVALITPVPPPDLTLCLIWLIALTVTLNLNIAIDKVEINFAAFFVLSAFMLFGTGAQSAFLWAVYCSTRSSITRFSACALKRREMPSLLWTPSRTTWRSMGWGCSSAV
jgi:hypothetical protein